MTSSLSLIDTTTFLKKGSADPNRVYYEPVKNMVMDAELGYEKKPNRIDIHSNKYNVLADTAKQNYELKQQLKKGIKFHELDTIKTNYLREHDFLQQQNISYMPFNAPQKRYLGTSNVKLAFPVRDFMAVSNVPSHLPRGISLQNPLIQDAMKKLYTQQLIDYSMAQKGNPSYNSGGNIERPIGQTDQDRLRLVEEINNNVQGDILRMEDIIKNDPKRDDVINSLEQRIIALKGTTTDMKTSQYAQTGLAVIHYYQQHKDSKDYDPQMLQRLVDAVNIHRHTDIPKGGFYEFYMTRALLGVMQKEMVQEEAIPRNVDDVNENVQIPDNTQIEVEDTEEDFVSMDEQKQPPQVEKKKLPINLLNAIKNLPQKDKSDLINNLEETKEQIKVEKKVISPTLLQEQFKKLKPPATKPQMEVVSSFDNIISNTMAQRRQYMDEEPSEEEENNEFLDILDDVIEETSQVLTNEEEEEEKMEELPSTPQEPEPTGIQRQQHEWVITGIEKFLDNMQRDIDEGTRLMNLKRFEKRRLEPIVRRLKKDTLEFSEKLKSKQISSSELESYEIQFNKLKERARKVIVFYDAKTQPKKRKDMIDKGTS